MTGPVAYRPGRVRERVRRRPVLMNRLFLVLLLFFAALIQTMPGFLCVGGARPAFLLPLCLAVSLVHQRAFYGALYGAATGFLWELTADRPCGYLALALFFLCILCGYWLRPRGSILPGRFCLVTFAAALPLFSMDFLFFYWMPGYGGALRFYLTVTLPCILLTTLAGLPVYLAVQWADRRFPPR